MSFILDALKKSEQARGLRKTLGLLDAPVSLPPLKSFARWPYIIAFVLGLNACFFAFWFHPWHRGGNTDWNGSGVSGAQVAETSPQADFVGPPAPLARTGDKPGTAGGEKEAGQGKTEGAGQPPDATAEAGQTADAVEASETETSVTPVQGTVQDHVSENKVHVKGPGAKQDQKAGAHRPDHAASQLASASPGGVGTTEAALKKPESSKPPQDSKAAGTKQGSKTSKAPAEALKKTAEPVESAYPAADRQWDRFRSAGLCQAEGSHRQTGRSRGPKVARTGPGSSGRHSEPRRFNVDLLTEPSRQMDQHQRFQKTGRRGDLPGPQIGADHAGWGNFQLPWAAFLQRHRGGLKTSRRKRDAQTARQTPVRPHKKIGRGLAAWPEALACSGDPQRSEGPPPVFRGALQKFLKQIRIGLFHHPCHTV